MRLPFWCDQRQIEPKMSELCCAKFSKHKNDPKHLMLRQQWMALRQQWICVPHDSSCNSRWSLQALYLLFLQTQAWLNSCFVSCQLHALLTQLLCLHTQTSLLCVSTYCNTNAGTTEWILQDQSVWWQATCTTILHMYSNFINTMVISSNKQVCHPL